MGIFRTVRDDSDFIERSTCLDFVLHICIHNHCCQFGLQPIVLGGCVVA